jgi:hypothetical protein
MRSNLLRRSSSFPARLPISTPPNALIFGMVQSFTIPKTSMAIALVYEERWSVAKIREFLNGGEISEGK